MYSSTLTEREIVEGVHFKSGAFALEGQLYYSDVASPVWGVLVAGPHPLLGGDFNNNVVAGIGRGLAQRGVITLTFNYRGVGGSEGPPPDVSRHLKEFWETSHVQDEPSYADDLRAARAAIDEYVGSDLPLTIVGYSFGCSLLPTLRSNSSSSPLVLIAPTVGTHDYARFAEVIDPILVIAPDDDFAADPAAATAFFDSLVGPKQIIRGEWDDHFFRGYEDVLAQLIFEFTQSRVGEPTCR